MGRKLHHIHSSWCEHEQNPTEFIFTLRTIKKSLFQTEVNNETKVCHSAEGQCLAGRHVTRVNFWHKPQHNRWGRTGRCQTVSPLTSSLTRWAHLRKGPLNPPVWDIVFFYVCDVHFLCGLSSVFPLIHKSMDQCWAPTETESSQPYRPVIWDSDDHCTLMQMPP